MITVDYHSHILPGIDDGAKDEAVSQKMLALINQDFAASGRSDEVHYQFATPHFRPRVVSEESLDDFLTKRSAALDSVRRTTDLGKICIVPGAEIALQRGIEKLENLEALALGKSKILLIEYPMQIYMPWMTEVMESICYGRGFVPVIAHYERYKTFFSNANYREIFSLPDVIIQFNFDDLGFGSVKKDIREFIDNGFPVVGGTDAHGIRWRKPNYVKGAEKLKKILNVPQYKAFRSFNAGLADEIGSSFLKKTEEEK